MAATNYTAMAADEQRADAQRTLDTHTVGSRSAVLIKARAILDFHHAGTDVFCGGRLQQWARLAPALCEPARWAVLAIDTHGVAVDGVPSKTADLHAAAARGGVRNGSVDQ